MIKLLRIRYWIAMAMATLSGACSIISIIWPEWIEILFEVSPDGGDGSAEWLVVLLLFVTTVLFLLVAYRERRAIRSAVASGL